MTTKKVICGAIQRTQHVQRPRELIKLGGSRYVCGKEPGHEGEHGDWRLMGQAQAARLAGR